MSNGVLPPVPDLIPISALRKNSPASVKSSNNSCVDRVNSASVTVPEFMGEQRPRRRSANRGPIELIDSAGSRGASAAPQALHTRKAARSARHRKSDRRRDHHRKPARTGSVCSKHSKSRERTTRSEDTSPERPVNPRVNPIFVWVRQENTHIVDVKCEDYDKRNRILLTKTAQGWRAIPRTETLVPSLRESTSKETQQHHHHHKHKKSRKNKIRRRSTGVQVSSDIEPEREEEEEQDLSKEESPTRSPSQVSQSESWITPDNVNVESLLPSHTIKVKRPTSQNCSPERNENVNSAVREAHTQPADKINDVTPLDNLLAVAELEFNQQIQSGEWNKTNETDAVDSDEDHKDFIQDLQQLNDFIESEEGKLELNADYQPHRIKSECDYNDDEENNLAMDDILSRLEQSLRSPECTEIRSNQKRFVNKHEEDEDLKDIDEYVTEAENDLKSIPELEKFFEDVDDKMNKSPKQETADEIPTEDDIPIEIPDDPETSADVMEVPLEDLSAEPSGESIEVSSDESKSVTPPEETEKPEIIDLIESTMDGEDDDEEPKDFSLKSNQPSSNDKIADHSSDHEEPTDLSIPKLIPIRPLTPLRPPSQSSEAIQSPQPSGIPAVPQSPDTVSTSASTTSNTSLSSCKSKSVFLETLLSSSTKKIALNSEVTIIRQKEPLDLGNSRKSASPTVTCSEEINNTPSESEPPPKKMKPLDITLKTLLDADVEKCRQEEKTPGKTPESSRLLELLNTEDYVDPATQLKQLLVDPKISIPDPILVPKDRFTDILMNPATEIPKLLKERPELRLPDALAYPHIMQDPNMLVMNIRHLQSILSGESPPESQTIRSPDKTPDNPIKKTSAKVREAPKEPPVQPSRKRSTEKSATKELPQDKNMNELANDIDVATQAAFNQMMWLPYLNHLEAMSMGGNGDFLKSFANSLPFPLYQNQMPDFGHMFAPNRFPPTPSSGFPMQSPMGYGSPLEFNMWQEAMLQANLLRNKTAFDNFNNKQMFKEYLEKGMRKHPMVNNNVSQKAHSTHKQPPNYSNSVLQNEHQFQNQYMNLPSSSGRQNMHMPQYTQTMQHHKNLMAQQKHENTYAPKAANSFPPQQRQFLDNNQNYSSIFSQLSDQEKSQYIQGLHVINNHDQYHYNVPHGQRKESNSMSHKPKLTCKPFANLSHSNQKSVVAHHEQHQQQQKEKHNTPGSEHCKQQTSQPIDLSGSTTSGSKLKVKQHLIDPTNASKLLKHHDDVAEVGSTTASIEDMQDAHKHLWHPLFGK